MFVIGITGGIGCGKSTAAGVCRDAGLPVIDADVISREVTAAGGDALPEIREQFGPSVFAADGSLDRAGAAKRVFRDHKALDQLSRIIHRHVLRIMHERLEALAQKGTGAAVLDVPIPVQEGFVDHCDQIWVVWAGEEQRIDRLAARGMEPDEARRRMAMQMTREEYEALADHVLNNDGPPEELAGRVMELLDLELGQRGIRMIRH